MTTETTPFDADLSAAEAELAALHAEQVELAARVRPVHDRVQELRELRNLALVDGTDPVSIWADRPLVARLAHYAYNAGLGSRVLHDLLSAAISALAPGGGFFEYEFHVADDYRTVTRLLPRLALRYRQPIGEVRDALLAMFDALAVDGELLAEVLEHTCGRYGTVQLVVRSADDAQVTCRGRVEFTGTLDAALSFLAANFWNDGGPAGDDD